MTPFDLARAAAAFTAARNHACLLEPLPVDAMPASLDDAYRLQAELARLGGGYRGWKVGALNAEQQARIGVERPTAARLLSAFVHMAPARLSHRRFVRPMLECELAFAMATDLPPRATPYAEDEVVASIAAMHLAIEIADSRLPPKPSLTMNLADAMASGGFVIGPAIPDWRTLDRGRVEVILRINGAEAARGTGAKIIGDPLRAVTVLANHPVPGSPGLRRGDFVTTGSLTGMTPVAPGDTAVAEFTSLGNLEVSFTP